LRVIGGRFRSRKLKSVPGVAVRPTPDRLRETLFDVLAPRLEASIFLDAYAGSGAVAIEALSRGAKGVILIERNAQAIGVIRENLRSLGIETEATLVRGNAASVLRDYRPDIAFIDPPYQETKEYAKALLALSESGCPFVVAQHESQAALENVYGAMKKTRVLTQGDNSLSFYERPSDISTAE
jgi:16S rRNA (guanine(966)-N(2))-methyltransferase RsmD